MKEIKVLGAGCANCKRTAQLIVDEAKAKGVTIHLEKEERVEEIARYGLMSTPGVVIDGKVVHAGGVPSHEAIASWL